MRLLLSHKVKPTEGKDMTRKDYRLIAQAIADVWCDSTAQLDIAKSVAKALATDNPRFDEGKFLAACGVN